MICLAIEAVKRVITAPGRCVLKREKVGEPRHLAQPSRTTRRGRGTIRREDHKTDRESQEGETPVTTHQENVAAGEPYDDLLDTLACQGPRLDPAVWDALVDRLAVHDVTHLGGGSADAGRPSPYKGPSDVPVDRLVRDLARAPEPRLRDALIALLLRHPENEATVRDVMRSLPPDDPSRTSLTARLLAAAALQRRHSASFAKELPGYNSIDIDDLVAAYGVLAPVDEDGRALLSAAQRLVAGRHSWVDYIDGWEDVARHTVRELVGVGSYTRVVARR